MDNKDIFRLFTPVEPIKIESRDSCHGDADFRRTLIGEFPDGALPGVEGNRLVVKLAANGFTDPEHLAMWERLARAYRALGYYCPEILRDIDGNFPQADYEGRRCAVWAEEFARYTPADSAEAPIALPDGRYTYYDDAVLMDARVAAKRFDFSPLPSAYALFDVFDKNDAEPEVLEVAHDWLKAAKALPERFKKRALGIWERWEDNLAYVRSRYGEIPTSIFQSDINRSNILLDEAGAFRGVIDFNIAGRDTLMNLIMREAPFTYGDADESTEDLTPGELARRENDDAVRCIKYALSVAGREYRFSDAERELALPLFRCVKPLWWTDREYLEAAKTDDDIAAALDEAERLLTEDFGFASEMMGVSD